MDHSFPLKLITYPENKVHGANMGPIWGRQDPDGPHVSPITCAIWVTTREQTTIKPYAYIMAYIMYRLWLITCNTNASIKLNVHRGNILSIIDFSHLSMPGTGPDTLGQYTTQVLYSSQILTNRNRRHMLQTIYQKRLESLIWNGKNVMYLWPGFLISMWHVLFAL